VYYGLGNGLCPGILFPFAIAKYTWTSNDNAIEQDPFVLQVRDDYGVYLNEYGFTVQLAQPTVQNGCLKGGKVGPIRHCVRTTLTLDDPPANATSYQWKIDGGNGAIVFTNGQQTIETTTPSATVKYVRVSGGGDQANLTVKVTDPNSPGELDYGPLSYTSCAALLDGSLDTLDPQGGTIISSKFTPKFCKTIAEAEKICGYFAFFEKSQSR
jgi:hypothetical protein